MARTNETTRGGSRLQTPVGTPRPDQPWWNRQRGSAMPFGRYRRDSTPESNAVRDRSWPSNTSDHAPLWGSVDLRDGNQSLVNPMDLQRKTAMFDLLLRIGFKDIEVGYPSSSQADFDFVRSLIIDDRIPDDVTISVFTPARPELIDRTFQSIQGADRAVVHLCHATACLWREVVFGLSADEVRQLAVDSAEQLMWQSDLTRTDVRFEYSPETFNVTEPDFALSVSNGVAATLEASPDRPLILNLPSTVETDSPNVFADQIEWMHRNLERRDSIILSVHPHNDRGTAVASAELAMLAGADRVEGTLFGNGERTGNVCLATLALNLFSRGIDPQLDFSDIDEVRDQVQACNQIPVHIRHPYAGDLVYTAFSGTHQDAIAKGLTDLEQRSSATGTPIADLAWNIPYLPIDPKDVGRSYRSVVRVNSQSGKGGIAHLIKSEFGLELPRDLRIEFGKIVQALSERYGTELSAAQLWQSFTAEYLAPRQPWELWGSTSPAGDALSVRFQGMKMDDDGAVDVAGLLATLARAGCHVAVQTLSEPVSTSLEGKPQVAYAEVTAHGARSWGAGMSERPEWAQLHAVVSAVNRALVKAAQSSPPLPQVSALEGVRGVAGR